MSSSSTDDEFVFLKRPCLYQQHGSHMKSFINHRHRLRHGKLLGCKLLTLCVLLFHLSLTVHSFKDKPIWLLFANGKDIRIIDAENPRSNVTILTNSIEEAAAVDYYYKEELVFWTDVGHEMIRGMKISGSGKNVFNVVTTSVLSPDGLACDWVTKKIYWVDSETNRIEVTGFDGKNRKVLFWKDLDQPRGIALAPHKGYIFFSDWGELSKIERASMDGDPKSRRVIVHERLSVPNGLTIDYEDERLFWVDAKLQIIESVDFEGQNRLKVTSGEMPQVFALTLSGDWLFWTDWSVSSISTCHKISGQKKQTILHDNTNPLHPMDIRAFSAARQPEIATKCTMNNGGCSHLCLLSDNHDGYSCGCPTGLKMRADKKRCADDFEKFLLIARKTDLRSISLDTDDFTDVVLPIKTKQALTVDFDVIGGHVYWTDEVTHGIHRARVNGSNQEDVITTEVHFPDGLAIDWVARNLYWTDAGTHRIEVARLDGTARKILFAEDLGEPRSISVFPDAGLMFWTEVGSSAKIERAALDGSGRTIIVNSTGWPNGLAIDYGENRIYWCDAKVDSLETAKFDGSDRIIMVHGLFSVPHPYGFTFLDDYVYWTDWQRRSIERLHKHNFTDRQLILDEVPDMMGLKAVDNRPTQGNNPCAAMNGHCSHLCFNRPDYDYVCACPMGYELSPDLKTCVVPEAFMLLVRKQEVKRISLSSSHIDIIPTGGNEAISAFDYDSKENMFYWTDSKQKTISCAYMNGSHAHRVVEFGIEKPEGLAVDWVAKNIYWVDSAHKRIEVAKNTGTMRKVLISNLAHPHSIALDPNDGFMFWSDWGLSGQQDPRIERASLDGTERKVVIGQVGRVNSLTIEFSERRLYYVDLDTKSVQSADFSGNNRAILQGPHLPGPFGLTLFQNSLFWTDLETNSIYRAPRNGSRNGTTFASDLSDIVDIKVYHASRQVGWNPCAVQNGGCSHLCLAVPSKNDGYDYKCDCPSHYEKLFFDDAVVYCSPPKNFLLYAQRNHLSRIIISPTPEQEIFEAIVPLHSLKIVKSLGYDPIERFTYWIDTRTLSIRKAHENGTRPQALISNALDLIAPYDLVVDPYSRLLFWTCSKSNSMNITRLDGRSLGSLIANTEDYPRALALHVREGLLFWVNMKSPRQIVRMKRDGTEREPIVEGTMEDPTDIALDLADNMLYWTDVLKNTVEVCDFNGKLRRAILADDKIHPISLAIYNGLLFWFDRDHKTIERMDKVTGFHRKVISSKLSPTDLITVDSADGSSALAELCKTNNGGCSHICLASVMDGKRACACPVGLMLAKNNVTCINPPTCSPIQFACLSGKPNCIPLSYVCDGTAECSDESDERDCIDCPLPKLRCSISRTCIDPSRLCDGIADCPDGLDEKCCEPDEFSCGPADGACILLHHVCDEKKDCKNGLDESPQSCFLKQSRVDISNVEPQKSSYTYVITLSILCFLFGFLLFVCLVRNKGDRDLDNELEVRNVLMSSARPVATGSTSDRRSRSNLFLNKDSVISKRAPVGPGGSQCPVTLSGSEQFYDRSNATGASSTSSSSANPYPQLTFNPPPSPATDRSRDYDTSCTHSRSSGGNYARPFSTGSHRRRPAVNRGRIPPTTTPCSTDLDSDIYASNSFYCNSLADTIYGVHQAAPHVPPPPPSIMSDSSAPPSPGTERSFFTHGYPNPPPSPVHESDNEYT
ncbi:Low-density lipoprotein receptor-related protein 6 [Halotydeus destructor]|nr:Low-density lipoprotein receptor-related protein 6 [Halotydeus destructor]